MRSGRRPLAWLVTAALLAWLSACMNHYAIYPRRPPPSVVTSAQVRDFGLLRIHAESAAPLGPGPFPTVLVHPAAGKRAEDLRGVLADLAAHGYLAIGVDYERVLRGKHRRTLFPFEDEEDLTRALALLEADPRAERGRMALLGFSQGAVFSLLIAAETPGLAGVVAYYPIADLEAWFANTPRGFGRRLVFRFLRRRFYRQSRARSEEEFRRLLAQASPLQHVERIEAPVLLVHGTRDETAPVADSRRLAAELEALGRDVRLLEVPDAGHIFNFRDAGAAKARPVWAETLRWLEARLGK